MEINLKIVGFPEVQKVTGNEIRVQMEGDTWGALLDCLQKNYDVAFQGTYMIKVRRDGREQLINRDTAYPLCDNDHIIVFRIIAGG